MKLLFITQKLHGQDVFGVLWANAFAEQGFDVTVLCLEWREEEMQKVLPEGVNPKFTVLSMGKERATSKIYQVITFWKHIWQHRSDRVFIHMAPVWGFLGAPVWIMRRTPVYLWYTHYKMQIGLKLLGWYGKRLFCATPQSLPQYEGNPKKIVTGHGIDMQLWPKRENRCENPRKLLGVYRLSRSKRLELCVRAMTFLPEDFTWEIYGIEAEPAYVSEIKALIRELKLEHRIAFKGTAPAKDLPAIYVQHRLILNMASETIDKTMLEAMTCGCYPVTTKRNAEAIGIAAAPGDDPKDIAHFIEESLERAPMSAQDMYDIVEKRHSLQRIVERMSEYMGSGS